MPIDVESDVWKQASSRDPIRVHIENLLRNNPDKAFSTKEIEEHLLEEHEEVFPQSLTQREDAESAKAARRALVANILLDQDWHSQVAFQYVSGEADVESGLYFTDDGTGFYPVAELDEMKDVDPDSTRGKLSSRFRKIDDETDDLEDQIDRLEYRIREEHGRY